ncbi:MAG: DUF4465 domain-containing protein [Prevotella sp.]|nr:DUF4465 domain-containing protein [Prevotella sp.]
MKQKMFSLAALTLIAANAWSTQVEVTMNAKSKIIKSLQNIATNESLPVGEPTGNNKYSFDVPEDGCYRLTAAAADGETISGSILLDIDADHTAFTIYSPEVRVKNANWQYDTDYTLSLKVTDKAGQVVSTTLGDYTTGNKMFLVFNGNTYYLDLIPSAEHLAEGYLTTTYTGTVSFNPTIQAEAPMSYAYSVTVPADAELFIGTKTAHFVPFKGVEPEQVETTAAGKVYTYRLADKQKYNYRVTAPGKLTHAGTFTMSGDETQRPALSFTDADMTAKSPQFIDHDVAANGGYNVGDIFLNINAAGHLQLQQVGDSYDLLPMRNWELVDGITSNYFIEPDFHFTVVNLQGEADQSVVKVENEQLTAVGEGTALVLVSYDAIHLDAWTKAERKDFVGGADWGAIWPENTGVFVVSVGQQAEGITPNIVINKDYLTTVTPWGGGDPIDTKLSMENVDAEFDVLYYLDTEAGFSYSFKPEGAASVTLARPVIGTNAASYNGFTTEGVTKNDDGSYTLLLTEGRNIVCLTDAAGRSLYQVITAKPCHRDILVDGQAVQSVKPGDAVTVQYSGLYHPVGKLAGIHNFQAFLTYERATEGITVNKSKSNQYTLASTPTAQAVTFTVPADFAGSEIELTDGVMGIGGFGDPVGNHRATSKLTGRAPNFTAISQSAVFGRVPAVTISVRQLPVVADFENLELDDESHMSVSTDDDDDRTEFQSGDFEFATGCMHDYDYWYFFGYANQTGTDYEELDDQWKNVVGGGYDGSRNYGVSYCAAFNGPCYATVLNHDDGIVVPGFYITNSAYAYSSMTNGDGFAKKFEKGDWFLLTVTGYDAQDNVTGTKEYYLADLRDAATAYIVDDWRYVDLSGLGKVKKLGFELTSSDNGTYGMNTPAYFCFDNFGAEGQEVLPEKNVAMPLEIATFENVTLDSESFSKGEAGYSTLADGSFLFDTYCDVSDWGTYYYAFCAANYTGNSYDNDYNGLKNVVGGGHNGSHNYGAFFTNYYGQNHVTVAEGDGAVVPGFYVTNSAYAYSSMTNGDNVAKKFGKGDWFLLTVTGYDTENNVTGTKNYYLADMRDDMGYIVSDWRYVDLSGLGKVKKLGFELTSSDNGDYGMNTPAYFCFDDFGAEGQEVLPEKDIPTAISSVAGNKAAATTVYDLNGRQLPAVRRGVVVTRQADGTVRKMIR